MACEERSSLWAFVAGELAPAQHESIEAHLAACEECRAEVAALRATREVLATAIDVAPRVDWRRADDQVKTAAARRLARLEWRWPLRLQWGVPLAAAACLAAFFVFRLPGQPAQPLPEPVAQAPQSEPAIAERVSGARLAGASQPLVDGESVAVGADVSTPDKGRALLKLPDGSRVRLAQASQMRLERLAKDDVRLAVEKGRVAIKAAHVERKGFVVEAAGARVRVVGTAFSVALTERDLDVAVVEGGVVLETGDGQERLLKAGERALVDRATWQIRTSAPGTELDQELKELGIEPSSLANGGRVAVSPAVAARSEPPAVRPEPAPPVPTIAPPPAIEPTVQAPRPEPDDQALEPIPVEEFFLRRAEAAQPRGECGRFQEGLAEYLEEAISPSGREKARWLRARCFDELLMPIDADGEYRRYLREFPDGPHAAEARRAVAH